MKKAFLISLLACLSGCESISGEHGYFHDRSRDYVYSQNAKSLVFPKNSMHEPLLDAYNIPRVHARVNKKDLLVPPTLR